LLVPHSQQRLRLALVVSLHLGFALAVQAGDGLVRLQAASSSCPDASGNIYVDCNGNGTVTDNRTGLVWLANANCIGAVDWYTAMEFVAGLSDISTGSAAQSDDCGLSDGSAPGEWRLPTPAEWSAMTFNATGQLPGDPDCTSTPPTITNDSGTGCWVDGPSSFSNVQAGSYWSSTTSVLFIDSDSAWQAYLVFGSNSQQFKSNSFYIWPVRGGQ
jgi:hypothetical protein